MPNSEAQKLYEAHRGLIDRAAAWAGNRFGKPRHRLQGYEELRQAALTEILATLPRFDLSRGTLDGFVFSAAYRGAVAYLRQCSGAPRKMIPNVVCAVFVDSPNGQDGREIEGMYLAPADYSMPDERVERETTKDLVNRLVDSIPDARRRNIVRMYYLQGNTLRQIGTRYGVTDARIHQLRNEGIQYIRTRLTGST